MRYFSPLARACSMRLHVAADEGDDLFDLRRRWAASFSLRRLGIGGLAASGLGNEVQVQREGRSGAAAVFRAGSAEENVTPLPSSAAKI